MVGHVQTEHASFCRICAAACGMIVTVDDGRVVRVRGDAEHPDSRGYVCAKARGLPGWHHRADRLDLPRVRGDVGSWPNVLDDLGSALRSIIDTSGPDAVGMYLATGLAYDAAGQIAAGAWMRSIGSSSFYSAATVDNAPVLVAAELVTGHPMLNPVWEPECDPQHPGLLLLVGTNPVISHGYGTTLPDPVRRLRDFRDRGGRVWVVDPRRSESAALSDEHIAMRPGGDVALLAAVARAILEAGMTGEVLCRPEDLDALRVALEPFTVARAATAAGVPPRLIDALISDVLDHHGRLAIFCGTGTTMAVDGVLVEWLRWVLLVLTDSLDRPGGMRFNRGVVNRQRPARPRAVPPTAPGPFSRPELPRVAGQLPAVALVDEIEAGRLRALVVTGGNPIAAFPEQDRVVAALRSLDVLAVVDVMENDLTALATHVLPATGQLERADITLAEHVSIRSGIQYTAAVVEAVAERRPVWWILATLAAHLEEQIFGDLDPDELTDDDVLALTLARSPLAPADVIGAGPHGIDVPVEYGWVRGAMLADGIWRIAPGVLLDRLRAHREDAGNGTRLLLTPRREMSWSNSVQCTEHSQPAVVRLHPADAAASNLVDGNLAAISSDHGTIVASVRIDDHVRPGVVSMTHGHGSASPGHLTSSHIDVDPLTTMPRASGLPVTIGWPS